MAYYAKVKRYIYFELFGKVLSGRGRHCHLLYMNWLLYLSNDDLIEGEKRSFIYGGELLINRGKRDPPFTWIIFYVKKTPF